MQLCYRGNTYYRSSVRANTIDSVITAKFMGNLYTIYCSKFDIPVKPTLYQYRGTAYLKSIIQSGK